MKLERYVRSLVFTMKEPVLVETKSQITAVNINTKAIRECLKLDQYLLREVEYKIAG